jgi:hypothetical protein
MLSKWDRKAALSPPVEIPVMTSNLLGICLVVTRLSRIPISTAPYDPPPLKESMLQLEAAPTKMPRSENKIYMNKRILSSKLYCRKYLCCIKLNLFILCIISINV